MDPRNAASPSPTPQPVSTFGGTERLRPDVVRVRLPMVNVFFLGAPGGDWVLVDAGMPGTAGLIRQAAREHHGARPPAAIVLTHGHLDHIGALHALLAEWRVPVYAHPLELPYLSGEVPYPFPDPTVGGVMSALSPAFVPGPFDFRPHLQPLPEGGEVPALRGWRVLATPGHTTGHVSLWREEDRTLIVGDAFVTTRQETVRGALGSQPVEVRRPPAYYTPNWDAAQASVRALADLRPDLAATGHGHPMRGELLRRELSRLAEEFGALGLPARGWYLGHPVPIRAPQPGQPDPVRTAFLGALGVAGALWVIGKLR